MFKDKIEDNFRLLKLLILFIRNVYKIVNRNKLSCTNLASKMVYKKNLKTK